jgi:hypothetical protein
MRRRKPPASDVKLDDDAVSEAVKEDEKVTETEPDSEFEAEGLTDPRSEALSKAEGLLDPDMEGEAL